MLSVRGVGSSLARVLFFGHLDNCTEQLRMSRHKNQYFSRRAILKTMGLAPLFLRPAEFFGMPSMFGTTGRFPDQDSELPFSDVRLTPRYPSPSPLADVLRHVVPGSDEYPTEKYAFEIEALLKRWGRSLKNQDPTVTPRDLSKLAAFLDPAIQASRLTPEKESPVRSGVIEVVKRHFPSEMVSGRESFLNEMGQWLGGPGRIETADFQITGIEEISESPLTVRSEILYDLVIARGTGGERREERIGTWLAEWSCDTSGSWKAHRWQATEETVSSLRGAGFVDVTPHAFAGNQSYSNQLLLGADHWRTILDGACGIDVYGNNGVATGDFDNDGFDDLYICQPAGLPNRLYRNRGDGTFEDVTEKSGVGVLDGTGCALFADFENKGRQDLLVVCGNGPLLFQNQGDGTFAVKRDAFRFANPPQGTFTHAALADYDGDGRLDIYFCMYSYYLGLDQYHYPVPYFDARNGPGNRLMHNEGNGVFVDRTEASGLNVNNDRYSFACAWGNSNGPGLPDLYVANDFGRGNLYRNNGDGTFASVASEAHADDPGAGMSATWCDYDNDGRPDIYAANMWSSAGQRVSQQKQFQPEISEELRAIYRRHARGNSLYRNLGAGKFQNVSQQSGAEMGRWSWCSDFWDFDHDGYPDLYVANGYISAPSGNEAEVRYAGESSRYDLGSFFWRQVVGKSPQNATPSLAYERGWNALNELIRSDTSWSGFERNVALVNNRDGTFSEASGPLGLDFPEDSRSFALADIDHDGRLEVILKNRNAPQLRILHNNITDLGHSIVFRLRGVKSNRDAIGAAITVDAGGLRQTKYLQAGSGFLAQHSKEVFFGVGKNAGKVEATVRWPDGQTQVFKELPVDNRVEIDEGSTAFKVTPFGETPKAYQSAVQAPKLEPLPSAVGTWLIDPLKAPEFALPDQDNKDRELSSFRGRLTLLSFWATTAPASLELLRNLKGRHSELTTTPLEIAAINIDSSNDLPKAKIVASREGFPFPVLYATEKVAGIYNIIYRYLFDRRRDLAIPTSFLLDKEGMIVKVYQGMIEVKHLMDDTRNIPTTAAARMQKAIPLGGVLFQGGFQRNDFTYGVALFQHGYLDQAAESFQQVIAAKPNDPEGYYNLGTLNLRRNEFDQARRYLEKTLQLRPDYPEAWNNLGMMAAQQGRPQEAIDNFEKSLQLRPGFAIALLNLGNVYRRMGNFSRADESLNQALHLQPDDPEIHYSLGMLYAQQNQMKRASEFLQKAIDLRPDYPEALNNLGVLFVRGEDYGKAEDQFKTCIRLTPNFDQSYINLARLYAVEKDKEKAREVLQDLLRIQPQNAGAKQALEMLQ